MFHFRFLARKFRYCNVQKWKLILVIFKYCKQGLGFWKIDEKGIFGKNILQDFFREVQIQLSSQTMKCPKPVILSLSLKNPLLGKAKNPCFKSCNGRLREFSPLIYANTILTEIRDNSCLDVCTTVVSWFENWISHTFSLLHLPVKKTLIII